MNRILLLALGALAVLGLAIAGGLSHGCRSSKVSARELADALSEEFTDLIDFEDGTVEDQPPPAATADGPIIRGLTAPHVVAPAAAAAPESVDYGVQFDLVLDTYSTPIDDGSVQGVIAHVLQANKDDRSGRHLRIIPAPAAFNGPQLTLRATIRHLAGIGGNAFSVRMAFLLTDGRVAPYRDWNLVLYPIAGETPKVPMCACYEDTHDELGYQVLDATNLVLADTCVGNGEQESIHLEYWGNPDLSYDARPCSGLLHSYFGVWAEMESILLPSGTRFTPSWFQDADPDDCWLQLNCE